MAMKVLSEEVTSEKETEKRKENSSDNSRAFLAEIIIPSAKKMRQESAWSDPRKKKIKVGQQV